MDEAKPKRVHGAIKANFGLFRQAPLGALGSTQWEVDPCEVGSNRSRRCTAPKIRAELIDSIEQLLALGRPSP